MRSRFCSTSVATRVSANEEAIRCLTRALSLLEKLQDERDRDDRELKLRSALSVVLNSARGYAVPEVEQNLDRVFTLLRAGGRGEVPVRWIWAAFTLRFVRGDLKGTREFAELALSRSVGDASCRCEAHHAMGGAMVSTGELEASRHHFEAALVAYDERDPQRSSLGSDLGVFARAWYAHTLWLLGDEDAAVLHAGQAVALARRLAHPYSETLALAFSALLHQMRRDAAEVLRAAQSVVQLCERYEIGYYGEWARVLIGWARGQERPAEGIETIEAALERLDATRVQARRSYYLSLLAELYALLGNPGRSASILDTAISIALERGDTWWLPALYLQKGVLEAAPARNAMLQRGLELARAQGSRGLERRILSSIVGTL
ncbi:MAG: hypothetical protein EHM13_06670 [Acidobacteria bacterium]|nr:MAG: hypothetical protein EHM13_06670 [Acidobacteriota bacterium]